MNKAQIISTVSQKTGVNKPIVEEVITVLIDEVISQMAQGNQVTFAGFGTFSPKERHARMGVNPLNPKEKIQMPATIVPKFKAGKTLKDALKESTSSVVASPEPSDESSETM
jgi:DNA-binding protein HU-beta